jgi:hypothetical protein
LEEVREPSTEKSSGTANGETGLPSDYAEDDLIPLRSRPAGRYGNHQDRQEEREGCDAHI